jgi:hypothetical protein
LLYPMTWRVFQTCQVVFMLDKSFVNFGHAGGIKLIDLGQTLVESNWTENLVIGNMYANESIG